MKDMPLGDHLLTRTCVLWMVTLRVSGSSVITVLLATWKCSGDGCISVFVILHCSRATNTEGANLNVTL